jgi:hypothetical protein
LRKEARQDKGALRPGSTGLDNSWRIFRRDQRVKKEEFAPADPLVFVRESGGRREITGQKVLRLV